MIEFLVCMYLKKLNEKAAIAFFEHSIPKSTKENAVFLSAFFGKFVL